MESTNNQVSNAVASTSTTIIPDIHPCQYCTKPCRGKQCKECHLNMVAKLQGKCGDCNKVFHALRKDGTSRKRCKDCHDAYLSKHYATCPDCSAQYHAFLEDGRVFDKCFECYNKSFSSCKKCSKRCFKDVELCSPCFQESKKSAQPARVAQVHGDKPCKTAGCKATTNYTFCRDCNYKNKNLTSEYMLFRCEVCGTRGRGDYRKCADCK